MNLHKKEVLMYSYTNSESKVVGFLFYCIMNLLIFFPFKLLSSDIKSLFISKPKPLIFAGKRSGEGYFNKNGTKIVFQSERNPENPFYEIFLMDLYSGKATRVSTGDGQTTCSWLHPDNERVLFSSTHLDPEKELTKTKELEERKNPVRSYKWDFDPAYDIFSKNLNTGEMIRLTNSPGYDAEASYSPDGKKIIFASNRIAYEKNSDPTNLEILKKDPSYFMDLYLMDENGKNIERITKEDGYDGGPFFSFDGNKITWRRFSKDGGTSEIYIMDLEERKEVRITNLKAMSWAPFFHPSGKYIIFGSNLEGFQNFELYIIDTLGKNIPIRVTDASGFDGLPVFHPNGRQISWTRRDSSGNSKIFIGEWNHELALKMLGLEKDISPPLSLEPKITEPDLKSWVYYLSSPLLLGRKTGGIEEEMYVKVIEEYFKSWNMKTINESFRHTFPFLSHVKLSSKPELIYSGKVKKSGKDYIPRSYSKQGESDSSGILFAGYGLKSPSTEKFKEYDSFKGLNTLNKWIVMFKGIPDSIGGEYRTHLNQSGQIQQKIINAKNLSVKGILFISNKSSKEDSRLQFKFERGIGESDIYVVDISEDFAEEILGEKISNLRKKYDNVSPPEGLNVIGELSIKLKFDKEISNGINLVGIVGNPQLPTILIGAHGDHLGMGEEGNSLAKDLVGKKAHLGADDNASGVSVVLELAHYFSSHPEKIPNGYSLGFAIWSGEEMGILGSSHFTKKKILNPNVYINLDMVGRLRDTLFIQGVGSASGWEEIIEKVGNSYSSSITLQPSPYLPTDAISFYVHSEVPIISFFTGSHNDYHTPFDSPDKINYKGLKLITNLCRDIIFQIPNVSIVYRKSEGEKSTAPVRGLRSYLGTIPDYSQEGVRGVRIAGTTKGSPAEIAGLQSGDIIVELSDNKIGNIYEFMSVLQVLKPNKETEIKVIRDGKVKNFKIIPIIKE